MSGTGTDAFEPELLTTIKYLTMAVSGFKLNRHCTVTNFRAVFGNTNCNYLLP